VAALPYDVFNRKEAAKEIAAHPRSFLRTDKTIALFSDEVGEYDDRVYVKAAEVFAADQRDGVYVCEDAPHYFCYRLAKGGHEQTGIVCCIAVEDYQNGVLRRHEKTRAVKLEDRIRHINALDAQTGPVLVVYRPQEAIDAAVAQVTVSAEPLYDFTAPDGVRHTVWRVDDPEAARCIQGGFDALDALYIADGHHRAAAAAQIGEQRRKEAAVTGAGEASTGTGVTAVAGAGETAVTGAGEADHFLIAAFPSDQIAVLDYNRVVFDMNGHTPEGLLARIAERFTVEPQGAVPCRPRRRGEFGMYLDGQWYRLTIHDELRSDDPVDGLDVSLLQDKLLAPLLGIDDPRLSKRIAYVGGVRGLKELERRVEERRTDDDGAVAFALFPCSLDELFAVADAGHLMPPKSTWFEPKPRSGIFIHKLTP
jgi:uncharacterized protein (DUF1015 family)